MRWTRADRCAAAGAGNQSDAATRGSVAARFPAAGLVSLHSELTQAARLRNWLAAADGRARIVLGTRLAVFTPLPDLALIIVDEERMTPRSSNRTAYATHAARFSRLSCPRRKLPIDARLGDPSLEAGPAPPKSAVARTL